MSTFKRFILFLHRWLGLISGLAVFIVSITGCIFVFQDEIQDAMYSYRTVNYEQRPLVKPSEIMAKAISRHPGAKVTLVIFYGPKRAAQVRILEAKVVKSLFFSPYSGKYLHTEILKDNFFLKIKEIHTHLLLPAKLGKFVNGTCTLIFIATMISGLVLWWPRRKSERKRCLTIKWNGKWKRINYDLHNVLGFYITFFAIIFAVSGVAFSFKWVRSGLVAGANLGKEYPQQQKLINSDTTLLKKNLSASIAIDKSFAHVLVKSPEANAFLIFIPSKATGTISVSAYPKPLHFGFSSNYAFDRYSGKLLNFAPYISKSPGDKLTSLTYDIHTGQIWGLPGKIIAFLVCLVSASLPVTGLILYLNTNRRQKKSKSPIHR
ncbi:PepSY-associated TM helix domain-containing protein [Pedobacter sp.]|uniref:PepSY-associated TM helix domain-containing protein n=1 Tax=Pedobacter sp. TaxID=1411316 RepID=UPI003C34419C